jgi:3-hydroxybutyryl-CoA dehydratase
MSTSTQAGLPALGARFSSRGRTVTEVDVMLFAALTGDWHPQHSDAEWAKTSAFGERIAHGMLVLSFALGLSGLDHSQVVAIRRLRDVVFKRPTRFGDTITAEVTVVSSRMVRSGIALVGLKWVVSNARGETLVRATIEVLMRTESSLACGRDPAKDSSLDMPEGVIPF